MRVTANSIQGHRKYMEDCYKIRFQRESSLYSNKNKAMLSAARSAGKFLNTQPNLNLNDKSDSQTDILFSYFGIFDGHGGKEASQFAKENLYWKIVESQDFWSDDDAKILNAIREGFIKCHMEMWDELKNWPKTPSGLPSTSGSTATVLFIKKSKAYVGHVGDSGLVIGYNKNGSSSYSQSLSNWTAKKLTKDHKPEDPTELKRIEDSGGSVVSKGGINRVVWNRPITNNLKRNTLNTSNLSHISRANYSQQTERIPFLAVARSLGDLWSYDSNRDEFIVSPVPDIFNFDIDPRYHKCLILATDGLWNVMRASECVELVRLTDKETEDLKSSCNPIGNNLQPVQPFVNPSQRLNSIALQKCCEKMIRADNTTCITIMLDQPIVDSDEDDVYFNSDDTVIQAASITNLTQFNKTFDKTRNITNDSEYYHENIVDKLNTKNENVNNQLNGNEEDEDIQTYEERRRKRSKRIFNQTTSTTIEFDFNTPLANEKRSRSLISLRRRHWSASSNRSTSNNNVTALNNLNNKNKFVNSEYSEQRQLFSKYDEDDIQPFRSQKNINKSNSSQSVSNLPKSSNRLKYCSNYESAPNYNQDSRIKISKKIIPTTKSTMQFKHESNKAKIMNSTSLSTFRGDRLSKNIRKSFNDIYSLTKNSYDTNISDSLKKNSGEGFLDDSKENQNHKTSNKYSKRLKLFKNQIKNNLFNRRRNIFSGNSKGSKNKREDCNLTKSMPDLNKIDLEDKNEHGQTSSDRLKSNHSFVNNFRSKFNNLKRNSKTQKIDLVSDNNNHLQSKRAKLY